MTSPCHALTPGPIQRSIRLAVLIYVLFLVGVPLVGLVHFSLLEGFGEFWDRISEPVARAALWLTIWTAVLVGGLNTLLGTATAWVLVRYRIPARAMVSALVDLPLAVSPVMIGLAFLLLLGRDGWLQPVCEMLHLKTVFAFPGLVIATLFVTLPYTIREVAYVMEEVGTGDEEAATVLGASPWQTFWHVTLPNVRLGLAYGLLMTAARTLGEFGAVLVLGGSISGRTQTATTFIHDAVEEREAAGAYGMAGILALASVALLLSIEWAKARRDKVST